LKRENWGYLRHGIVIWLDVPVEHLKARLQGDSTRPLLQGDSLTDRLHALLEQRQALYAQADVRVLHQPDETPEQLAGRILEQTRQIIRPQQVDPNGQRKESELRIQNLEDVN
jgi:shikimate kinase